MKPACIIRPHRAGLWSLINNVATCGELYEDVRVEWDGQSPDLIYKGEGNLWDFLFAVNAPLESLYREIGRMGPGDPNDEDCDELPTGAFYSKELVADEITNYPDQHLTYKNVAKHYTNPTDPWRKVYHRHARRWGPHVAWVRQALNFVNGMGGPFVAVQVRSGAHGGEQVSGKLQALDHYADVLHVALRRTKEETGLPAKVMVVASDWESVGYFQKHFGARYFNGPRRSKTRDTEIHLTEPQTFHDAANCLCEVMAMCRAHALVHPVSNMATGALYLNPDLQSFYIP